MNEDVPSKWLAVVVQYGEKKKHLFSSHENTPHFFATEPEAQKWAEDHCRYDQRAIVAILRVERLILAKPVEFAALVPTNQ